MDEKSVVRKQKNAVTHHSVSRAFYLEFNDERIRVCSYFFHATLDISTKTTRVASRKKSVTNTISITDMRGKAAPANKTPTEIVDKVKQHIDSFPRMESHYCRASSNREYLEPGLNITKMHHLYLEWLNDKHVPGYVKGYVGVNCQMYRRIFCDNFNLSFYTPKKDKCSTCESYNNLDEKIDEQIQEQKLHRRFADECRDIESKNKERPRLDNTIIAATFDLQSILQLLCSEASPLYYKRKLTLYNLTVREAVSLDGHCYVWTEVDGRKGANEIATALYLYLTSLPPTVFQVLLSLGSCNGQNQNQFVSSMLLYVVKTTSLETIEVNFLEPGHTQMEADSMHSAIEKSKKVHEIIFCAGVTADSVPPRIWSPRTKYAKQIWSPFADLVPPD